MELDRKGLQQFREDFDKAVEKLEKKYGMSIELGNIRFNGTELRSKLTATVGTPRKQHNINEFSVGDYVGIDHKRVEKNASFKVIKVNRVRVLVEGRDGERFNVQPQLLIKKSVVGVEV
jgi:hypothetical protein